MLDGSAISAVADLARQKDAPAVLHANGDAAHVFFIRKSDGSYEKRYAEPTPRGHIASDLSAIAEKCAEVVSLGENRPEIWYCRSGIVLFLDELPRRDRVTLPLQFSPQLTRLMQWEQQRTPLSQQDLILAMRTLFRGATQGIDLGDLVRRIRTTVSTASDQQRTRASLGKQIEAAVGDQNSLPDYVTFIVPIFSAGALAGITDAVAAAFDFDGETQRFFLQPVAGEIEYAITNAESRLGEMLRAAMEARGVKPDAYGLYYGKP